MSSTASPLLATIGDAFHAAQGTPLARNGALWKALQHAAGADGHVAVLPTAQLPDDFHFAKGVVVALPAEAPLPLDLLNHERPLSAVASVRLPATYDVSQAAAGLQRAQRVLQARSAAAPVRLAALVGTTTDGRPPVPQDLAHWEPTLGARGVLSVVRAKRANDDLALDEDAQYDHYLVYAGAPERLQQELYAQLRATPTAERPSVGSFVGSLAWRAVESAVKRNARGVLAVAAEEMGAPVRTEPDTRSCYASQRDVQAPLLAVPDHLQLNGGFEGVADGRIAALAGVTSTKRAHNGRLMLSLGPLHGFALYAVVAKAGHQFWPVGPPRNTEFVATSSSTGTPLPTAVTRRYLDVRTHADASHPRLQPERYQAPSRAFHQDLAARGWDRTEGRQHYELLHGVVETDAEKKDPMKTARPLRELEPQMRAGGIVV